MTYKGIPKKVPPLSVVSGMQILHKGYIATVLDHPCHIRYKQSGKKELVSDAEAENFKVIVLEYFIDPLSLDPKDDNYKFDITSGAFTKEIPLFDLQWQEVINGKQLDTSAAVEFVADYFTVSKIHPNGAVAYIIFDPKQTYSAAVVKRIARSCYEYGFKMGQVSADSTLETFHTPFEVMLSGLMCLKDQ